MTSWLLVVTEPSLVAIAMLGLSACSRPIGSFLKAEKLSLQESPWFGPLVAYATRVLHHSDDLSSHAGKWYVAADLAVLLFPYLALIALAAACNATLNVLQRFTEPALSPIWLNLMMIASLGGAGLHFAHTEIGKIHWLVAGVLAGGFRQMAVPAGVVLIHEVGWRLRFRPALCPTRVRAKIALLMTPGLYSARPSTRSTSRSSASWRFPSTIHR